MRVHVLVCIYIYTYTYTYTYIYTNIYLYIDMYVYKYWCVGVCSCVQQKHVVIPRVLPCMRGHVLVCAAELHGDPQNIGVREC